jgi:hypothetical protein
LGGRGSNPGLLWDYYSNSYFILLSVLSNTHNFLKGELDIYEAPLLAEAIHTSSCGIIPQLIVLPHLKIKPVGEITHLIKSSFNFSVFISCFKPAFVRKLMLGIRLDDQKPYFNLKFPLLPTQ